MLSSLFVELDFVLGLWYYGVLVLCLVGLVVGVSVTFVCGFWRLCLLCGIGWCFYKLYWLGLVGV